MNINALRSRESAPDYHRVTNCVPVTWHVGVIGADDRGEGTGDLDHAEYVPKLRAGPGICAGQSDFRTGLENRYGW